MKPLVLSAAQQRRLEKLAQDAGRSPAQTLKFVLKDGFEFCEWEVRESAAAGQAARGGDAIPNDQVQRDAQRIIDAAQARKSRKAA